MLVSPSAIDLSSQSLRFLAQYLPDRWRELSTRSRKLPSGQQALLALTHLRCGDTYAQLAAGFGVGVATVYRYIYEAVSVLAAVALTLEQAVTAASAKAFVILDGMLLPIDRIAADHPFYFGKHKKHGMNVQVIADPFGRLMWASPALPGAIHDITAARSHRVIDALAEAGIRCFADKGYQGARGTVIVPVRGKQAVNIAHTKIRAVGEQTMATFKGQRLLRKLRTTRITDIVKAVSTLHLALREAGTAH